MGDMRRTPYKPPIPVASKYTGKEAIEASSYGFCAHCGRGDAKAKCGNCSQVAYCGKECQRAAWKEHKLSGYCVPHCNICAGPTRNPCKTLPCKHKICGLCYDECRRLGCGGYCAKCDKFHLPSHPDDEGDRAMRCGALKDFLVAERMDRTIRERSRTMGMTKDESQRFAAWLRSGTNRCDVALERDPADQHVHCVLGMIKRSQGDAVNAAASFGNCLEIEPSHPAANFYMGLIAMKNGDHCAATRRFQHAIKSDEQKPGDARREDARRPRAERVRAELERPRQAQPARVERREDAPAGAVALLPVRPLAREEQDQGRHAQHVAVEEQAPRHVGADGVAAQGRHEARGHGVRHVVARPVARRVVRRRHRGDAGDAQHRCDADNLTPSRRKCGAASETRVQRRWLTLP